MAIYALYWLFLRVITPFVPHLGVITLSGPGPICKYARFSFVGTTPQTRNHVHAQVVHITDHFYALLLILAENYPYLWSFYVRLPFSYLLIGLVNNGISHR